MFSSDQLEHCAHRVIDVREGGQEERVDVVKAIGANPISVGALDVAEPRGVAAVLRWRCEQPGVTAARYDATCTRLEGAPAATVVQELACAAP